METRGDKAKSDARFEAEAEARERRNEERAEQLFQWTITDGCSCDWKHELDEECKRHGECQEEWDQ